MNMISEGNKNNSEENEIKEIDSNDSKIINSKNELENKKQEEKIKNENEEEKKNIKSQKEKTQKPLNEKTKIEENEINTDSKKLINTDSKKEKSSNIENPNLLESKLIEYDQKEVRPKVTSVYLTTQANIDKAFSTDIIIINLTLIGNDNKKYEWNVRQTYKTFKKMTKFCEERLPERKKIINVHHELTKRENEEKLQKIKTLPKDYFDIFYKIYKLSFSKAKQISKNDWIKFIQLILNSFLYSFYTVKEFFEISNHSFVPVNNGIKPKEGEITKQAEYSVCQQTCIDMCHCVKGICCAGKNKYWFLLKPDMICFLDNSRDNIGKGTFWFDNETTLEKTKGCLILRNSMRKIKLTFDEEFQRNLWFSEIDWRLKKYKENYVENKYGSFVLEKNKCKCQWFIDGKDYFEDLKKRLLKARETVFITDWWMSPELFLSRPVELEKYKKLQYGQPIIDKNPNNLSRLCDILNYIANERRVRVYILLYCEFSLALTLNSKHTKIFLTGLSQNIKVIRHPKKSFDLLWSHHEKLVVIDQEYAYVGGLDLCWGRYDNHAHPIIENENEKEVYEFPFIDYSNARINDFMDVPNYLKENVDRRKYPKMPWHDIHSSIQGPAVLDIARHFVERWNYSKSSEDSEGITDIKTEYTKHITTNKASFFKSWLGSAIKKVTEKGEKKGLEDIENSIRKDSEKKFNTINNSNNFNKEPVNPFQVKKPGFSFKNLIKKKKEEKNVEEEDDDGNYNNNNNNNNDINNNNNIINNNNDIQNRETEEINTNRKEPYSNVVTHKINTDFYRDVTKNTFNNAKDEEENNFDQIAGRKTENGIEVRTHKKKIDYLALLKAGMKKSIKNITQKKNTQINKLSNYINLKAYNVIFSSTETRMTCQCLRSLCYWSGGLNKTETSVLNGYYKLIEESKHYIYIENQFFISKSFTDNEWEERGKKVSNLIINEIALKLRQRIEKAHQNKEKFRVMIIIPLLPGFAGTPQESSTLQVILKFTYKSISRNDGLSLIERLKELLDESNPDLFKEYIGFFSLRNHDILNGLPVTELIYIHSKLMIVDDQKVIIGSANINDRSMTGERDSEFAVIFSDENENTENNSIMDGNPYHASKFAKTLRLGLWREHLGLKIGDPNYILIEDPLNDDVWKLINETARVNTDIYRDLFKCYPDDTMLTFKDIPSQKELNEKEKEVLIEKYNILSKNIKGHIVEFPYDFLKNQILERSFFSAEMLVPIKNFV